MHPEIFARAQADAAEGHPALRPAGLRQDADREGGRQQPREEHREADRARDRGVLPQREGPRAPEQVRRRDRAQDPRGVQAGAREGPRGRPRRDLLRRDGLALPHARIGHLLRHGSDRRRAVPVGDRRRRVAEERDRDRRQQPPGPDRSGGAAPGPPRPQGQGEPPGREGRARDLHEVPDRRTSRSTRTSRRATAATRPKIVDGIIARDDRRACTRPATRTSSSRSPTPRASARSSSSRTSRAVR